MNTPVALALLALLLAAVHPLRAEKAERTANPRSAAANRQAVDGLSDAELEQVLPLLKEHFINPAALGDAELRRATVHGLLDRIAPGASILQAPTVAGS